MPSVFDLVSLLQPLLPQIKNFVCNRPQVAEYCDRIEDILQNQEFKNVLRKAFRVFDKNAANLPFFDKGYVEMPEVQRHLARYIVEGEAVDLETLLEQYEKRFLAGSEISEQVRADARAQLQDYLQQLRKIVASNKTFEPLLAAHERQAMLNAINRIEPQLELIHKDVKKTKRHAKATKKAVKNLAKQINPAPLAASISAILITNADDVPEKRKKIFGREDIQRNILADLQAGNNVVLHGFSGMGKTVLAAEITAQWINQRRGSVLWLRAGAEPAETLFQTLAHPFGATQTVVSLKDEAQVIAMRQLLRTCDATLLCLDDAWNEDALYHLARAVPDEMRLMVTSRQSYTVGKLHEVNELEPVQALETLSYYAEKDVSHAAKAPELCKLLGYLAYALEVAGRTLHVDDRTPEYLYSKLEERPHELSMPPGHASEERNSFEKLLQISLDALDEQTRAVFMAFGAFWSGSATAELLMRFFLDKPEIRDEDLPEIRQENPQSTRLTDDEVKQGVLGFVLSQPVNTAPVDVSLSELRRRNLVKRINETLETAEFYRVHDLAYSYLSSKANETVHGRALDACIAYTWHYNEHSLANFKALTPEVPNFLAAATWAFAGGYFTDVEQFAWNLYTGSEILDYRGLYRQTVTLLNQAANAAERQGNRRDQGAHLNHLGLVLTDLGQMRQAIGYHEQALAIARDIGDKRGEGSNLGNLGNAYADLGELSKAIEYYEQALALVRDIGDKRGVGSNLGNLGNAYADLGISPKAIRYFEQALVLARDIGDKRSEGNHLSGLGISYAVLGEVQKAIGYYEQALAIVRDIGDKQGEGYCLGYLGSAYYRLGEVQKAIGYYEQALAIVRDIGDKQGQASHLHNLGLACESLDDLPRALDLLQQARTIFAQIGASHRITQADENISRVQSKLSDT